MWGVVWCPSASASAIPRALGGFEDVLPESCFEALGLKLWTCCSQVETQNVVSMCRRVCVGPGIIDTDRVGSWQMGQYRMALLPRLAERGSKLPIRVAVLLAPVGTLAEQL